MLSLVCVAVSCGRRDESPPTRICTGGDALTTGALSLPQPSRVAPGMQVMWENGSSFVYVDGSCRFWARTPFDAWAEVRTGALSPELEREVVARLRVGYWRQWAGDHVPRSGAYDADLLALLPQMRVDAMVQCFGGCEGEPIPTELQAAAAELSGVIGELWSLGVPVAGDVRLVLVREEGAALPLEYFDWPLEADASALAIGELEAAQLGWGEGRLASGAEALRLRALREAYRSSSVSTLVPQVPVRDTAGNRYKLFFRDTTPHEDESGLVRPR